MIIVSPDLSKLLGNSLLRVKLIHSGFPQFKEMQFLAYSNRGVHKVILGGIILHCHWMILQLNVKALDYLRMTNVQLML